MVKVKEDLTGRTFGKLIVKEQCDDYISKNGKHIAMWLCDCECGKTDIKVVGSSLKSGNTTSCGCIGLSMLELGRKRTLNVYDISGDYGVGWTHNTNNKFYFDLEDYDKIKGYCWFENDGGYAVANIDGKKVRMHRLILNAPNGIDVDHIFHNKLDNRKEKLRLCTRSQNLFNKKVQINNKSGKQGVYFNEEMKKYRVTISVNKEEILLGWFCDINSAIKAREDAEIKYFGEYRYKVEDKI